MFLQGRIGNETGARVVGVREAGVLRGFPVVVHFGEEVGAAFQDVIVLVVAPDYFFADPADVVNTLRTRTLPVGSAGSPSQ